MRAGENYIGVHCDWCGEFLGLVDYATPPTDRALLQRLVDAHDAAERLAQLEPHTTAGVERRAHACKVALIARDQALVDAEHLLSTLAGRSVLAVAVRDARRMLAEGGGA